MVGLKKNSNGSYSARKRLPNDIRDEYAALHGPRLEAKFSAPASTKPHVAKQEYGEWLVLVEGRIAAIRAKQKGEGIALTQRQARALAGEWYAWFIARHPVSDVPTWENLRDKVQEVLQEVAGDDRWHTIGPNDLWRDDEEFRKEVRPVLADVGETAQFLAIQGLALNNKARDWFLDWLYDDLSAALRRLMSIAGGDYHDDGYAERFPKFEGADAGETPQQLFDEWVFEKKPARGTVESWQYVFAAMAAHYKGRSAASISPEEAQAWIKGLVGPQRSARTVANTWITASRTVFGWAVEHKHSPRNPFVAVKVTIPKSVKLRETQAFQPEERQTILKAALAIADTDAPDNAARRWAPWLCAYTGARAGEITQLRNADVFERDGIPAIRITPAAGAVKGNKARVVPLHEHVIAQGFLAFVAQRGEGPLFYNPAKRRGDVDAAKSRKPRAVQARQRLAAWVRSIGVTDNELSPNHAWRHTFKQIADRAGISGRMSDSITGHAHRSVGERYGAPTLEDMAEALKKFPRYSV